MLCHFKIVSSLFVYLIMFLYRRGRFSECNTEMYFFISISISSRKVQIRNLLFERKFYSADDLKVNNLKKRMIVIRNQVTSIYMDLFLERQDEGSQIKVCMYMYIEGFKMKRSDGYCSF